MDCALFTVLCKISFTKLMYFFRYGLGYMKGSKRYTVFMGVNIMVSNTFFSFLFE